MTWRQMSLALCTKEQWSRSAGSAKWPQATKYNAAGFCNALWPGRAELWEASVPAAAPLALATLPPGIPCRVAEELPQGMHRGGDVLALRIGSRVLATHSRPHLPAAVSGESMWSCLAEVPSRAIRACRASFGLEMVSAWAGQAAPGIGAGISRGWEPERERVCLCFHQCPLAKDSDRKGQPRGMASPSLSGLLWAF